MSPVNRREVDFRAVSPALVRATHYSGPEFPEWPDPAGSSTDPSAVWTDWLRRLWAVPAVADAISHASPSLDGQVRSLLCAAKAPNERRTRRATLSVARYLQRMTGRPTPSGLFAGIAPAAFSDRPRIRWGTEHQAVAHADAGWLAEVIGRLENCPEVVERLPVVANTTLVLRGDRLVVPYRPNTNTRGTGAVEISLRLTGPVRIALENAQTPIRFNDLKQKVQAEFPGAEPGKTTAMLTELVACGALITSLHAPGTETDALGHLVRELEAADVWTGAPVAELKQIHALLERHRHTPVEAGQTIRSEAAAQMRELARTPRHPVAVDLRLDAHVVLPDAVAREAERAAQLLTRLSAFPYGTDVWRDYHRRFYERFGAGALVPLREVVADSGIGWPDGYPGTAALRQHGTLTRRDEKLLELAQRAALEGQQEILLDEFLIGELEQGEVERSRPPAHLELCFQVHARDLEALEHGDFRLVVASVSRAAGVVSGRFLHLLDEDDRRRVIDGLARLPGNDVETVCAQLSFPPLDPATAHVTRSVRVLPTVISLAEHRDAAAKDVLTVDDLAVGCDSHRLYLAIPRLGVRVEAWGLHALNPRVHTPPMARFVSELSRAQCVQVTDFDWGAAAKLPFLPRLRCGRVVLAPARWLLTAADLPDREANWQEWDSNVKAWCARRRLPSAVCLVDGDWRLPLDLDQIGHRVLLREHLRVRPLAVLEEVPAETAGWCEGRAHEIVVPLAIAQSPDWPRLPSPVSERVLDPRGHVQAPAVSPMLFAKLYGDVRRQDTILGEYLPELFSQWGESPPLWWFLRFQEGADHYLRLRIRLSEAEGFGEAADRVSAWAERLRRHGLLREVAYATSCSETGRWGSGPALTAAEAVFAADSQTVLAQFTRPQRLHPHVLAAANFVSIATAFTGSVEAGVHWLIDHVPAAAPEPVPRPVFTQAQQLADPNGDFQALRRDPAGAVVVETWTRRSVSLADYRRHLPGPHTRGVDPDAVLDSLLHTHFLRSRGVNPRDKAVCLYLARTAALTFVARAKGSR